MKWDPPRLAVALAGVVSFLDLYCTQSVLPQLADQFQISASAAGATVGATTLAVAVSAPFSGILADRLGHRATIVGATLLLIVPTVLIAVSQTYDQLVALRFVQGLLIPAIFTSALGFTSDRWAGAEAADVNGYYILGSVVGGFMGRFLTAVTADQFGWRSGFALLAILTALAAAAFRSWLPPTPRRGAGRPSGSGSLDALIGHLRNLPLMATCIIGAAVLFANVATFTYVNFYLSNPPFSLSQTGLGLVFVVYLMGAPISPFTGRVIGRLGRRAAVAVGHGLGALGLIVTLIHWLPAILVGLTLFVSGVFMAQAASLGFIGQATTRARSTAVGLYVCCYYGGGSLGAVLPGGVWMHAGWPGCVALIIVMTMSSVLGASLAWKPRSP